MLNFLFIESFFVNVDAFFSDPGLFVYGCDLSSTAIQLLRVSLYLNLL